MSKVTFLLEDHNEALEVWRQNRLKDLDLVHIDAHIDFGFYPARPVEQVMREAKSLEELKRGLEYSISFRRYESDFDKQINIGNYVYPAMREGIVRDFYWVVPGGLKEFKESGKLIKNIVSGLMTQAASHSSLRAVPSEKRGNRRSNPKSEITSSPTAPRNDYVLDFGNNLRQGIIQIELLGRKFIICILEKLPKLNQELLLDIDTDFLVIDSLLNANNTAKIGKRKRWIRPDRLVKELLSKELKPALTTIAYSVNGGYTPMRYKILGDELAYRLSPKHFKGHYGEKFIASFFFERFELTGKKEDYQKAVNLNPAYRAADNNYGPLYLSIRKFSQAAKEFSRIAGVDPKNPHPLIGLGNIALEKRDFFKAKEYFSYVLSKLSSLPGPKGPSNLKSRIAQPVPSVARNPGCGLWVCFASQPHKTLLAMTSCKTQILLGLAKAEFELNNFQKAKVLFIRYRNLQPLQPQSYYFLGCIYEKEADFEKAAGCYLDALRLGLSSIDVISRLLKISYHTKIKDDIIKFAFSRYKEFKKGFLKAKRLNLRRKKVKELRRIEQRIAEVEKRFRNVNEKGAKFINSKRRQVR